MGIPATEGATKKAPSVPPAGSSAQDFDSLDITVLMGGPSSEHDVSLLSGGAIADALESLGHRVTRSDIGPKDVSAIDRPGIDLVFIALHGWFGESGHVQELCERRGLRYVGSNPLASRIAMDKHLSKQAFRKAGLLTPDWAIVRTDSDSSNSMRLARSLPLPVVVKPVDGGSSVDVTIAHDEAVRDKAIESLLEQYASAMVERFIKGREMTVSLLGDEALPLIEVIPGREFYDYTAKYADGAGTRYSFKHGLDAVKEGCLLDLALQAHRRIGCDDMSRVDFILDDAGKAWLLEINTIPGFTSHSLLPMAGAKVGLDFSGLVDRIVRLAMRRQARLLRI